MRGMKVPCSLGTAVPYEEFMALINDVFGFTGTGRDFRTLLPKLYRPGRSPQCENYDGGWPMRGRCRSLLP